MYKAKEWNLHSPRLTGWMEEKQGCKREWSRGEMESVTILSDQRGNKF